MKKVSQKTKMMMPFDYMPDLPEEELKRLRKVLFEKINKMHLKRNFSLKLQTELVRHLIYSSRLNFEEFSEIYLKLKTEFEDFFGQISSKDLFKFFDEDCDSYLNEDEQLLIFTVLISKFYHLLEEVNFYSLYDLDPQVRSLIRLTIESTINLEKNLRNRFYSDQKNKFSKFKDGKMGKMEITNAKKFEQYEEMRGTKNEEFNNFQMTEEANVINKFKKQKSLFSFNKFSDLRHFLIQEKLLGLNGHHEEAKNTGRNYQKYMDKELGLAQKNIESAYKQASKNFKQKCDFRYTVLENKFLSEKEKMMFEQREKKTLLEKNLNVMENKLRVQQNQSTAQSAFTFLKNCKINLLKSENALKKDFAMKINTNLKSIFQQEIIHSYVFKLVFLRGGKSLLIANSTREVLENLKELRNSSFNVRLSLRNLESRQNGMEVRGRRVGGRVFLEECLPMIDNNGLKLTMLYDDNLNEKVAA